MKKLEQIQKDKLISSYGGVGSLVETNTNGALLIQPYDTWPCYNPQNQQNREIDDPRLLNFVRENGYPHIQSLVAIPEPSPLNGSVYAPAQADLHNTVAAKRFPEWYYCPRCRRLKKLVEWRELWQELWDHDQSFDRNEPACPFCSTHGGRRGVRRQRLEQVRFVMASLDSGEIADIPFDTLWDTRPAGGVWELNGAARGDLQYRINQNGDGLNSVYIRCNDQQAQRHIIQMSELERNYLVYGARTPKVYQMTMRGSQSLYLPNIVRSLYIPGNGNAATVEENAIPVEENNITVEENAIRRYELQEFCYLVNDERYNENLLVGFNGDLYVRRKPNLDNCFHFITRISAAERLKEVSVLLSYTRLGRSGENRQWYDLQTQNVRNDVTVRQKKPFREEYNPIWMPALESYGEGLLFEVNVHDIPQGNRRRFVHTFCHIVMKEMEFECGYPLTSLKEKIYIDGESAGFLIYTIDGSEGSLGGLVALSDDDRIIRLIENGCARAAHCPNDPICISVQEDGAHCFACLDIPETSCIKFNKELDRKTFLDALLNRNVEEEAE